MKKRVQLDLFLDTLSKSELDFLKALKSKSVDISNEEKSIGSVHDCGHDEGKACTNVVRF